MIYSSHFGQNTNSSAGLSSVSEGLLQSDELMLSNPAYLIHKLCEYFAETQNRCAASL